METAVKFYEAMAQFFEQIEHGVRASTLPIFREGDKATEGTHLPVSPGSQIAAVVLPLPNGDCMEVGFGNDGKSSVALTIGLRASNMKNLAALVDIASAGLCAIDGVSLVEGWANCE